METGLGSPVDPLENKISPVESSSIDTGGSPRDLDPGDILTRQDGSAQCRCQRRMMAASRDADASADHLAQRRHLPGFEVGVHLGRRRSEPGHSEDRRHGQGASTVDDRDVVPRSDAGLVQTERTTLGQRIELGVGQALVPDDQRRPIRNPFHCLVDRLPDEHQPLPLARMVSTRSQPGAGKVLSFVSSYFM